MVAEVPRNVETADGLIIHLVVYTFAEAMVAF
jgi:hypothetical protein